MTTLHPAEGRRRTTLAAVTIAVAIGVASLIVATERDPAPLPASTALPVSVLPPGDAPSAEASPADASLVPAVDAAAAGPSAPASDVAALADTPLATDAAPPVDDPFADVLLEPVDPAEALFGEQAAAVAVSN